jgi:ABC-2 type transport system permease protein
VLSWIHLTSPTVLASRLMLTAVPLWEVALSLALLWGSAWGLRRMAGKVFATTILMYGKEPTLREMWRWARQT